MTKNYFTDGQLNAIHKEICRLEDLESGTSLPVHPLNNVETANLRRICNLAVEAAIGQKLGFRVEHFDGGYELNFNETWQKVKEQLPLYSVKAMEN